MSQLKDFYKDLYDNKDPDMGVDGTLKIRDLYGPCTLWPI